MDLVVDGLIDTYVSDLVERGLVRSPGVEQRLSDGGAASALWRGSGLRVARRRMTWGWTALSIEALKVVYSDEALITRRDAKGDPTSSASQPAVVAMMLEALDLQRGDARFGDWGGHGLQRRADGRGCGRSAAGYDD